MAMIAPPPQMPGFGKDLYEDQIVPALRKRLEEESRTLAKRMSSHSILSQDDYASSLQRELASSFQHDPIQDTSDPYLQTAIPRRNVSGSRGPRPSAVAESSNSAPKSSPFKRPRTYSTPYPFELPPSEDPPIPLPQRPSTRFPLRNGSTTPESVSRSVSPSVLPPSRIPQPTGRVRSSSKSSRAVTPVTTKAARALTPQREFVVNDGHIDPPTPNQVVERDSTTQQPSSQRDANDIDPDHITTSTSAEPAPAQFEHWYRGEGRDGGGRNGGRGEILPGTREMLEIAMGGHPSNDYVRRRSWKARAALGLDAPEVDAAWDLAGSRPTSIHRTWADEYVLDEPPLTDIEADGDVTDVETLHFKVNLDSPRTSDNHSKIPPAPTVAATSVPFTTSTTSAPATPTARTRDPKVPTSKPRTASRSNVPVSTPSTPRQARIPSSVSAGAPSPRKRVRKKSSPASVSTAIRSRSSQDTSSHLPPLADAIPPWEDNDPNPGYGNWDEVILPAIAKKMRLAQGSGQGDIEMMGTNARPRRVAEPFVPPPAPGTFGYDSSKVRSPRLPNGDFEMLEFGVVREEPPEPEPKSTSSPARSAFQEPVLQVQNPPDPTLPVETPAITPEPVDARVRQKELRKNKPAIKVISPSIASPTPPQDADDDEHNGGCCKCIIM